MSQSIMNDHNSCWKDDEDQQRKIVRSPLKQRLIDLERGLTLSFRGDSIFFVHIFSAAIISCTAMVLEASVFHWILLFITVMVVLASEIFHQAIMTIAKSLELNDPESACKIKKISTAGEMVCIIGATITVLIILADCAWKFW